MAKGRVFQREEKIDVFLEAEYRTRAKEPKIVDYDFRRPQKFSRDQLENVQVIYENFGRIYIHSIGVQIRAPLEIKVDEVCQRTYQEFISTLPNPSCLGIVNMNPWKGVSLLEVDNIVILGIIDCLLGGTGEVKESTGRELTQIELEVAKNILNGILESLKPAWAEVDELDFNLKDIMSNPERVQLLPPHELVLAVILGVKIGRVEGAIRHAIPYSLIEPIAERLSTQYKYLAEHEVIENAEVLERLRAGIQEVPVKVIVELGRAQISMGDILGLQVGDVVKLTTKVNDGLVFKVGNQKKFLCRPGVIGNKMAVQIISVNGKG